MNMYVISRYGVETGIVHANDEFEAVRLYCGKPHVVMPTPANFTLLGFEIHTCEIDNPDRDSMH